MGTMREDLSGRFDSVDRRLEKVDTNLERLNSRTSKNENQIARHEERLKTLFRRAFGRRQEDRAEEDGGNRRITQRDLAIVLATLGIEGAVIVFVKEVWPAIAKVVTP